MDALKVMLLFIGCAQTMGAVNPFASIRIPCSPAQYSPSEDLKSKGVRYQVCAEVGGITYYCPGDGICCIPGSPSSNCCPEDKPLCIDNEYCCAEGYPKLCGEYCCTSNSYCCDNEFCCTSEDQCCGPDQCCQEQAPCCTGPDENTCCDKDLMACCDGEYGCVAPCECPFDAIGCNVESSKQVRGIGGPPKVDCPSPAQSGVIYRILRPDENCNVGLIAKNPLATKTVLSHVNCGSRNNYASQYISFSSSIEVANYYKNKFGPELQIAVININNIPGGCQTFDLTSEAERDMYLGNAVCKRFAKASCEVLLSCGIALVPCTNTESVKSSARDTSEL